MDKSQAKKIITTLGMLIGIVVIGYVILTYIYRGVSIYRTPLRYCESQLRELLFPERKEESVRVIGTRRYNYNKNTNRQANDKFADLVLNDVAAGNQANSDILTYYDCYFNENTTNNLLDGSNTANLNYVNNSEKIVTKLNELSGNIDERMIQLNNDILNNIGENYARAHLLNKQREEMKKTLNDLPLKNI